MNNYFLFLEKKDAKRVLIMDIWKKCKQLQFTTDNREKNLKVTITRRDIKIVSPENYQVKRVNYQIFLCVLTEIKLEL